MSESNDVVVLWRNFQCQGFISGFCYYELFVNGKRIGDQVLDPGWTNYKKTVL